MEVQTVWPENAADDAVVVNQFALTWDNDRWGGQEGMYLLLGHIAPPMWVNEEDARQRLELVGNQLRVQHRGAYFLSRARAEELYATLANHLGKLPIE